MEYVIYFVLFALSVSLFIGVIYFIIVDMYKKMVFYKRANNAIYQNKYSYSQKLAWITFFCILSIFFLRYEVALFGIIHKFPSDYDGLGNLNLIEEIVNSFLHTLQTFSMDEDYTLYWNAGKEMMSEITSFSGMNANITNFYVGWFSFHTALLNITAPVIDGAIVLGLLSKVFPKFQLWISNLQFWREKYYFSELNANSLALSRSILSDKNRKNSIIIFTDAYSDDEEEESTEFLLEAKSIGAICIKDDITHLKIRSGEKTNTYIMLIDKEEGNNVEALTKLFAQYTLNDTVIHSMNQELLTIKTIRSCLKQNNTYTNKRIRIYVFSTDRQYSFIEDTTERILNSQKEKYKHLINAVKFSNADLKDIFTEYFDYDFSDNMEQKLKKLFSDGLLSASQEEYIEAVEDLIDDLKYKMPPLRYCLQLLYHSHTRFSYEDYKYKVQTLRDNYFNSENGFLKIKRLLTQVAGSSQFHSMEDMMKVSASLIQENSKDIYIQLSILLIGEYIKSCKDQRNGLMCDFIPVVIPVNSMKNMSCRLLQEVPLFEPLIVSKRHHVKHKNLKVTIIGSGALGTELFLSVYSFGQIIGHQLQINVVSKETQDGITFEDKLNYINPEILLSGQKENETLIFNNSSIHTEYSEPYMEYKFYSADVYSDAFSALLQPPSEDDSTISLLDSDYFIVALGSDEQNCEIANYIKQLVANQHIITQEQSHSTVIAYVVYNSTLCQHLNYNSQKFYTSHRKEADIYMYAFGCLDHVYDIRNVFFDGVFKYAQQLNNNFSGDRNKENSTPKKYNKLLVDYYNYKSSNARVMHKRYQYYSAWNCLTDFSSVNEDVLSEFNMNSIFDSTPNDEENIQEAYKKLYTKRNYPSSSFDEKRRILSRLAWLEHRRWCAFMRANRFHSCHLSTLAQFYELDNSEHNKYDHKFLSLKSHPCIIECSDQGILADIDSKGRVVDETEFQKPKDEYLHDKLDELSYFFYELKVRNGLTDYYDFKRWDYPNNA